MRTRRRCEHSQKTVFVLGHRHIMYDFLVGCTPNVSFCVQVVHTLACPFSRHFGIFHGPKRATTGSKRPKNTCLSIPSGLGTTLKKIFLFAPGTPVDPPLAPTVRGPGCPPAPPSDRWYGGLGGSLGASEAWKPQKMGVRGWTRCPRNQILSHIAQDTARPWFRGVGALRRFWGF